MHVVVASSALGWWPTAVERRGLVSPTLSWTVRLGERGAEAPWAGQGQRWQLPPDGHSAHRCGGVHQRRARLHREPFDEPYVELAGFQNYEDGPAGSDVSGEFLHVWDPVEKEHNVLHMACL